MRRTLQKPALYSLIAGPIIFGLPLAGLHAPQAPAAPEAAGNKVNIEMTQVEKVSFTAVSPTGDITMTKSLPIPCILVNFKRLAPGSLLLCLALFGNGRGLNGASFLRRLRGRVRAALAFAMLILIEV